MRSELSVSAIVPVTERLDDVEAVFEAYKAGIEAAGHEYEFVYVLDGQYPEVLATLQRLKERDEKINIVSFAKWFGESTALTAGVKHAAGDIIVTLPAYLQVDPGEIPRLIKALDNYDLVIGARTPRRDPKINRIQSKLFHAILKTGMEVPFQDIGSAVRVFRRQIMDEIRLYGDQHRFMGILALRRGLRVVELPVAQAESDRRRRLYPVGVYVRRMLDILAIVFLVKFTEKPLRFFGLVGLSTFFVGFVFTLVLVFQRLFFDVALADRPALILGSLMIVLGLQIVAVGLIGEIIIFTRAKGNKPYTVERTVN